MRDYKLQEIAGVVCEIRCENCLQSQEMGLGKEKTKLVSPCMVITSFCDIGFLL